MKRFLPFLLPFLLAAMSAAADNESTLENLKAIGELPMEKNPDMLTDKDRNPFVRREEKTVKTGPARESEENRLRVLFSRMSVTGMIRGQGTTKVLLDNIILKLGEPLPPVMADQTEKLMVSQITEKQVELEFIETEELTTPRKIVIPIDIRPRVESQLPSARPQVPGPSLPAPKVNLAPPETRSQ